MEEQEAKPKQRGWLRQQMPETAAFIDQVREAFCQTPADHAELDAAMKRGLAGQRGWFYAKEGEREVGTK